MLSRGWKPF